jgi:hypothetical protein
VRLHHEKYFNLGHKHLALGNRVAESKGFQLGRFQGSKKETFFTENSIWNPAINPTGRLHHEKYFNLGQKHLAPGNRVAQSQGFLFGRFQGSKKKTFSCRKFNLESSHQSYREIASRKIFQTGAYTSRSG